MAKNSNPRANVKNPNNPAFKAAVDNRSVQLNPNNLGTKPTGQVTSDKK